MSDKKSKTYDFQIVRRVGTPKQGTLPDGTTVYAQDKFWIPELSGFIRCMPYDDHFLYEIPEELAGLYPGAIYRCSCGSSSSYYGVNGYVWGASPQGLMFCCDHHINFHTHATGGSRWI
jgi:hypothetical protein